VPQLKSLAFGLSGLQPKKSSGLLGNLARTVDAEPRHSNKKDKVGPLLDQLVAAESSSIKLNYQYLLPTHLH